MSTTDMSSNNNSITSVSANATDNNMVEGAHHVSTNNNTASIITTPINTHDDTLTRNSNNTAPIYPAVNNNMTVSIARYDSSFNNDDDSDSNESSHDDGENNDTSLYYTTPVKNEEDHSSGNGEDREGAVNSSNCGVVSGHTIKLTREIEELGSLNKKILAQIHQQEDNMKPASLKPEESDSIPPINATNAKKHDDEIPYTPTKKTTTVTHYPFKKSTKQQQSTTQSKQQNSIPLHTLPTDALHTTSSYCTPTDWAALCTTNKTWANIGKDIFGKVWRHAGLCMLEVGYAWARGEHADARELASLYISKGVPIYPTPHGHSYHTIVWRMGIELENNNNEGNEGDEETAGNRADANNNVQQQGGNNDNNENDINVIIDEALGNNNGNIAPNNNDMGNGNQIEPFLTLPTGNEGDNNISRGETDAFYTDRYVEENGNNDRGSLFSRNRSTYVEEKAIFWKQQKGIEVDTSSGGPGLFPRRRFSFTGAIAGGGEDGGPLPPRHAAAPQAAPPQDAPQAADNNDMQVVEEGIRRPPPGIEAASARPQSAVSGQRLQHDVDGVHRYARRSSFSGSSSTTAANTSPTTTAIRNPSTPTSPSNYTSPVSPKLLLHIHRHLADQHFFGSASVNDESGTMSAGSISMNADFFHPTWEGRHSVTTGSTSVSHQFENWQDGFMGDADQSIRNAIFNNNGAANAAEMDIGLIDSDADFDEPVDNRDARHNPRMVDSNYRAAVRAFVSWTLANADRQRRNSMPNSAGGTRLSVAAVPSLWNSGVSPSPASPASDVHLDVYSSTSANLKSDNETDTSTSDAAVAKMYARCLHYQQLMNTLLKGSNWCQSQFQELLLDFWDELFPSTAGIHFYNQQSPVPRMSKLHTFLTTPCPKAIGTIQCEIERVSVRNRKGGKGVKGRFFPSYEYRLFIRDTKNDNPFHSSRHPPRQDSVLLVAKSKSSNRNRNVTSNGGGGVGSSRRGSGVGGLDFATPSVLASPANSPGGNSNKRGITNFYMSLPQQRDVDSHYISANRNNINLSKNESSRLLGVSPLAVQSKDAIEVGRLQSNFIGTEFQIFSPTKTSTPPSQPPPANVEPEPEVDVSLAEGDSRVHPVDTPPPVTNTTARRRSRRGSGLVRLAQRASMTMSRRGSARNSTSTTSGEPTEESVRPSTRRGSKKLIRRLSWGSSNNGTKRMSLGNFDDLTATDQSNIDTLGEVESGAITYTANLLGNRPRIMDVCIPKLTEDGKVCDQWSGEREENIITSDGHGAATSTMLDRFKTIQQGMDNEEDTATAAPNNNAAEATAAAANEYGLMMLQNRPPWWNLELGAFVLNFGGRVKVASVKNFQLCERDDQEHVMQFGRIEGRHAFTLDYAHPLTPVQAFAIAISSLQSKISFG